MKTQPLTYPRSLYYLLACAIFVLLLSACQPAGDATSLPIEQPTATTSPTQPPAATQPPAQPTQALTDSSPEVSFDLAGVAQDQTVETIAAVPPRENGPSWDVLPEHSRVTLQGYPVTEHLMQPQIFVYPVAELAVFNEGAGKIAADLQTFLQTRQPGEYLPFLPLFNAQQVIHSQVQYLEFKNGTGVRFLTQFDQAPIPINNYELFYTFQGLTNDGKYYVAAVLPVTHPELPITQTLSTQQVEELAEFPAYLAETSNWLDQQPAGDFTPDLSQLDALIQSIEVK